MSLVEAFQEVHGVGEEKATKLAHIVEEYGPKKDVDNIQQALDYLQAGHPGYAEKFLKRELE